MGDERSDCGFHARVAPYLVHADAHWGTLPHALQGNRPTQRGDGEVARRPIRGRAIDNEISEKERRLPLVPAGAEKDELVREISTLTQKKRELKRPSWFR